jgi:hypothetical protein
MTKITDIYEGGSHQMEHCDPCGMPEALAVAPVGPNYSLIKHIIIESREVANNAEALEHIRLEMEARDALPLFEAAQKCIRCSEGLCLLTNGNKTGWQVGGPVAVQ